MSEFTPTPMQVHFDDDTDDKGRKLAAVFVCKKEWADLAATDRDDIKFCASCKRSVYLIDDASGFTRAVAAKQCVAVVAKRAKDLGHHLGGPILIDYHPGERLTWDD